VPLPLVWYICIRLTEVQRGLTRVYQNGGTGDSIKVKAVGKLSGTPLSYFHRTNGGFKVFGTPSAV
jgi:hypothetical protein